MNRLLIAAIALAAFAQGASAQAPSREEQAACRSDATRYCASHIGKPTEMRACMVANKSKLSEACKAVIESRGG